MNSRVLGAVRDKYDNFWRGRNHPLWFEFSFRHAGFEVLVEPREVCPANRWKIELNSGRQLGSCLLVVMGQGKMS